MELKDLLKMLGDLANLLTAGGEHVYDATYQSVLVSTWREIYILAGLSAICAIVAPVMLWTSYRLRDRGEGWEISTLFFGSVTALGAVVFIVALASRIFDLQRLDYLTIEALMALTR